MAVIFAYLALLMTIPVPSGFMAERAADGSVIIRVCNGKSGSSQTITRDNPLYQVFALIQKQNGDPDNDDDDSDDGVCDVGTSPVANIVHAQPFARYISHPIPARYAVSALTGIFPSGLPPATGPPLS